MKRSHIATGIAGMLISLAALVGVAVAVPSGAVAQAGHSPSTSCWQGAAIPYLANRGEVVRGSVSYSCHTGVNSLSAPMPNEMVNSISIKGGLWMKGVDGKWYVKDGGSRTCTRTAGQLNTYGGTCTVYFEVPCEPVSGNQYRTWRDRIGYAEAVESDGEVHRISAWAGDSWLLACWNG